MKKRIVLIISVGVLFLVGFQITDQVKLHLLQSPGAEVDNYVEPDYGLGSGHVDSLKPFPNIKKGERTPFDLWIYAGKNGSSFMNPNLPMSWEEWLKFHEEQKPELMADVRAYMNSRYDFNEQVYKDRYMSGGRKMIMKGPIARLPKGIRSFEELAKLQPEMV